MKSSRRSPPIAILLAAVLLLLALAPRASSADVIHLESGGRVVGEILKETPSEIVIKPRIGGEQTIPREEIASIEYREEKSRRARPKKATEKREPEPEPKPERADPEPEPEAVEKWSAKHDRAFADIVEKVFTAKDPAAREAAMKEAAGLPPPPKTRLKRLAGIAFKGAFVGPRSEVGQAKRTLKHPDFPGTYQVHGEGRGKRSLLIGLHGGGQGSGDGANSAQKWSFASGMGSVTAFPTVLEKVAVAWNREDNEQYVIELIHELRRTYDIDTNRVYLVGHSMGGFGTWSIGSHYADVFAAISPNAGGVYGPGKIPNLHNTPIYFYHSLDDATVGPKQDQEAARTLEKLQQEHGGYEHHYEELNGIGHGLPKDGLKPIVDWLFRHTRDPYPKKVVFEPARSYKRTLYWLKSLGARGRIVAEWKDNDLTITGPAADYTVFVNPKMVDLREEVSVTVNGRERFRGEVPYSAWALLESVAEKRDPNMYFTGRIDIR